MQHKIYIAMMANKHKGDKDSTNEKNVKDLTTYDKKLIEQEKKLFRKIKIISFGKKRLRS